MMTNAPKQQWKTVKKKDIFEERRTYTEENRRNTEDHRENASGKTILCEP
jgi:hypothetical protein